jgi:hypothetical protein
MPHLTEKIFGLAPGSPEFEELYGDQLRRLLQQLAGLSE